MTTKESTPNPSKSLLSDVGSISDDLRVKFQSYLVSSVLAPEYHDPQQLAGLSQIFLRDDYVRLPGLIDPKVFSDLREEVFRLCGKGRHRDFNMPGYDTPRIMTTLGGQKIAQISPLIASLYVHYEIRGLIDNLAGHRLYPCRHREEYMVLNHLAGKNETHGWHLDDPSYALVIFFEAPAYNDGGCLEMIRPHEELGDFRSRPINDTISVAEKTNRIERRHHNEHDAYLLRADICLHRVTPLSASDAKRTALNLAFERTRSPTYGNTASILYEDEPVPLSPAH